MVSPTSTPGFPAPDDLAWREIAASLPHGFFITDRRGQCAFATPALAAIIGRAPVDCLGAGWSSTVHPDDRTALRREWREHVFGRRAYHGDHRVVRPDGTHRWVRVHATPYEVDGAFAGFSGIVEDITERRRATAQLARERERALVTLQSITDAVITVDDHARVDYMNPVAQALTGWDVNSAVGRPIAEVMPIRDEQADEGHVDPVTRCLAEGAPIALTGDTTLCDRSGNNHAIDVSVSPLTARDDTIEGAVITFRDVGAARRLSQQLTWHAEHDPLTGLANRRNFERNTELAIESARHRDECHALVYMDLDQFKIVNDTCGHSAGDRLLREVSHLLGRHVRASDVLARLGGDEFGVLLRDCPLENAREISEAMRVAIERHRFAADGKSFPISGSFGVVPIDENAATLAELMRAADGACYIAKERGRNQVHCALSNDDEIRSREDEMEWVGRVRRALDENRLVLFGQPIVPLFEGGAPHIEVLLRMKGADGVLVPPMAWIPAAERYGLMPELDRWVIRRAFDYLARRALVNPGDDTVCSINLSGASIGDPGILEYVRREMSAHQVPADHVCFEITETAVINNLGLAQRFITELRRSGVRFALDDFGAGMSSFAYLKALPVDYLKIDGGFVRRMVDDPVDYAMVEAINNLGHVMKILTVAEFVENDAILARLKLMGVDYGQGHGIAEPGPLEEVGEAMSPRRPGIQVPLPLADTLPMSPIRASVQ